MKFRFPVVIIDEDFRSENTSGLGIRALAKAIEDEGYEVLGVTSYGDLTSFAQQQSRASAFILSIDDEEFVEEVPEALEKLRGFVGYAIRHARLQSRLRRGNPLPQCRDPDLPARRNPHFASYSERDPA